MNAHTFSRLAISTVAVLLGFTTFAQAGPLLICHPIEIEQAKSLPWVEFNHKGRSDYDLKNLSRDTIAILDSRTPVLVRMETLRRATIYARQDPQAAKELITRLQERAENSDASGHPDALAWFDVGYLADAYKQWLGKGEPNPAAGLDGYRLVRKAISLRGSDPEMEFAAALITLSGPDGAHRDHVQRRWQEQRAILFSLRTWLPTSTTRRSPNFWPPRQEGYSDEPGNEEVSYRWGSQILASPLVGMWTLGCPARRLDRRRAHASRPHRPRVGNVHCNCREGRSSGRVVAVRFATISSVHRSTPIRGAYQRRQLQAGAARHHSHGDASALLLFSTRRDRVSESVLLQGAHHRVVSHADRVQPAGVLTDTSLSRVPSDGSIAWNHVAVSPNLAGEFPGDAQTNRYYAARETASSPLRVQTSAGEQQEKFLFYRGVSASPLPLSARLTSDG